VLLAEAIKRLPQAYGEVIILRHLEGLSFPGIAERMNRSLDSVEKLWMRGLTRLRRLLARARFEQRIINDPEGTCSLREHGMTEVGAVFPLQVGLPAGAVKEGATAFSFAPGNSQEIIFEHPGDRGSAGAKRHVSLAKHAVQLNDGARRNSAG